MSINAISSVSIYEYFYKINENNKKKSPIEKELKEYGIKPTDSEELNIALLKQAKSLENTQNNQTSQEVPYSQRPWADVMYQLNLPFNENPRDDIQDIIKELSQLTKGVNDSELEQDVKDLEDHVKSLYLSFEQSYLSNTTTINTLDSQLGQLALMNQVNLL